VRLLTDLSARSRFHPALQRSCPCSTRYPRRRAAESPCCCHGAASAIAADSCKLPFPPKSAAVVPNHGEYYFVSPRKIDRDFTGCQTMWNSGGGEVMQLKFERGVVTSQRTFDGSKQTSECLYARGRLTRGGQACPKFESIGGGILTMSINQDPVPPADKDPRR
jgi:hypothetical protein